MTAIERAWGLGWSIDCGVVNPAGQKIERLIKIWNIEGRRDDPVGLLIADVLAQRAPDGRS